MFRFPAGGGGFPGVSIHLRFCLRGLCSHKSSPDFRKLCAPLWSDFGSQKTLNHEKNFWFQMGKPRLHRLCFSILRLSSSFWRCPLSKRTLIIATVCLFYLFFVVLYVGHSKQQRDRRTDLHKYGHTRGLDTNVALLNSADTLTDTNTVVPTRSNVVYITLRSKRMKPSNIRGTVRPKLRKKVRNNGIPTPAFTHEKFRTLERDAGQIQGNSAPRRAEEESRDIDYKPVDNNGAGWSKVSSIRIYSQRAPHWFSAQDVKAMRYLADGKILRLREVYRENSPSLLMFEGEASDSLSSNNHSVCTGQCGVIHSPVDTTQVFAFHLDRVLGLNRTLPAVSRKFRFIHGRSAVMSLITALW